MAYITVDVDLDEFTDDELMDELKSRNVDLSDLSNAIYSDTESILDLAWTIWGLRRTGRQAEGEIDRLISELTGRLL